MPFNAMHFTARFVFVLIFSVVIGIVAGIIPAYRVYRMKPVDALRYE